jgi:hypothetical protein
MWFYSDMELMKERFSKLLLGEDMSGGGKGVSSALALSNAITNLSGTFFSDRTFVYQKKYNVRIFCC